MKMLKFFINFHDNDGHYWILWILFLLFKVVVVFCQAKFAFDNRHDFALFSGAAATFFVPLLGNTKLFSRLLYDKTIRAMFKTINETFWDTSVVDNVLSDRLSKRITFVSMLAGNHMISSLGICFILALFPLAKYPDGTKQLPSVVWFPFNTNPSPIYEIIYFILGLSNHITVMCNANYDHTYIYFSQHLSVQLCILKDMLRNIANVPEIPDEEKYTSKQYQEIISKRLQTCVNHHTVLTDFFKDIQDIFSLCLGIQLVLSILSIVFIGYILETDHDDIIKSLKLLIYVGVLSIQVVLYALHGTELENQYETVATAIYESQWYFGDKAFSHGIRFMQMNSQKPVTITALGLADINNTTIVMIYRTVFSILTLIRNMLE